MQQSSSPAFFSQFADSLFPLWSSRDVLWRMGIILSQWSLLARILLHSRYRIWDSEGRKSEKVGSCGPCGPCCYLFHSAMDFWLYHHELQSAPLSFHPRKWFFSRGEQTGLRETTQITQDTFALSSSCRSKCPKPQWSHKHEQWWPLPAWTLLPSWHQYPPAMPCGHLLRQVKLC